MGKLNYYKSQSRFKYLNTFIYRFVIIIITIMFLKSSVSTAVCSLDGGGGGVVKNIFNPSNYEKDDNQKHEYLTWKHENGSIFDDNAIVFYKIKGAKAFACQTYQEWLNAKQLSWDSTKIGISFIPGSGLFKSAIKAAPTILDISGAQDKLFDDTESKISMFNDVIVCSLDLNAGRGFFFFEDDEIDTIKKVNFTFCKCDNDVGLVGCISDRVIPETVFDDDIDNLSDLSTTVGQQAKITHEKVIQFAKNKIKDKIVKEIKQKVGHAIAKQAWKQTTKKGIGTFIGNFSRIFVPGVDVALEKAKRKNNSTENIVKVISFNLQNRNEKIIGFALDIPQKNKASFYAITSTTTFLIDSVSLDDSTHMLVDLVVAKNGLEPRSIPTLYAGKLKK